MIDDGCGVRKWREVRAASGGGALLDAQLSGCKFCGGVVVSRMLLPVARMSGSMPGPRGFVAGQPGVVRSVLM